MRSITGSSAFISCAESSTADAVIARYAMQQGDDLLDAARVEIRQRLIEQQQRRLAHERVGDEDALLLAAREAPDSTVRESLCVDVDEQLFDAVALLFRAARESVALRVEPECDEVTRAYGNVGIERHLLGHVAERMGAM